MRLAPVPIYYNHDAASAIHYSIQSATTTHGSEMCLQTTGFFGGVIRGALNSVSKEELLSHKYSPVKDYYQQHPSCDELRSLTRGDYKAKHEDEVDSTGFVIDALEAALWSFYNTDTYGVDLLKAVNLGGDADTVGAIYWQFAGAYYGFEAIPAKWIKGLAVTRRSSLPKQVPSKRGVRLILRLSGLRHSA